MSVYRKPIRLPARNYRGYRRYFITMCCANRSPFFRDHALCSRLIDLLRAESATTSFLVPAFCFMPDHLHVLLESQNATCDLIHFVKLFKQKSGYEFRHRKERGLWQRFFYDHILRGTDSVNSVAWYIWLNPVRAGICSAPQAYPFSGSLTTDWRARCTPNDLWTPPWKKKQAT